MSEKLQLERLRWACRRGMLELDLILEPYVNERFPYAESTEQHQFIKLLESNDQDLFDWFLQKKSVDDPELAEIISIVLAHTTSKLSNHT